MDLNGLTKGALFVICKDNNIKVTQKLKKDEIIAKLNENGITSATKDSSDSKEAQEPTKAKAKSKAKKPTEKAETKPRVEKIDKKLAKAIDLLKYDQKLLEEKEEPTREFVLELLKTDIEEFVKTSDVGEIAEFVDKFGALTAINFQRKNKNSKLSSKTDDEIYRILILALFLNEEKAIDALVKAVKKHYTKLHKPVVEKKKAVPKTKLAKVEVPSDNEEDDEDDENDEVIDEDDEADAVKDDVYNQSEEDDI